MSEERENDCAINTEFLDENQEEVELFLSENSTLIQTDNNSLPIPKEIPPLVSSVASNANSTSGV